MIVGSNQTPQPIPAFVILSPRAISQAVLAVCAVGALIGVPAAQVSAKKLKDLPMMVGTNAINSTVRDEANRLASVKLRVAYLSSVIVPAPVPCGRSC